MITHQPVTWRLIHPSSLTAVAALAAAPASPTQIPVWFWLDRILELARLCQICRPFETRYEIAVASLEVDPRSCRSKICKNEAGRTSELVLWSDSEADARRTCCLLSPCILH